MDGHEPPTQNASEISRDPSATKGDAPADGAGLPLAATIASAVDCAAAVGHDTSAGDSAAGVRTAIESNLAGHGDSKPTHEAGARHSRL